MVLFTSHALSYVKIGHYCLAWVTAFDTGLPVHDVRVQLTTEQLDALQEQPTVVAEAMTNADGLAAAHRARVPSTPRSNCCKPGGQYTPHVIVRLQARPWPWCPWCTTFRWMPTVPIARTSGVPGAPLRAYPRLGHHAAGVYRAGDTVQYKVYVRDQDNQRFIPAPRTGYRLQIIDPTDKVAHEVQEVSLSAFGAYHGEFTVPQNGAVGWYRFVLSAAFAKEDVRVENR